jgi:hypothetical protein
MSLGVPPKGLGAASQWFQTALASSDRAMPKWAAGARSKHTSRCVEGTLGREVASRSACVRSLAPWPGQRSRRPVPLPRARSAGSGRGRGGRHGRAAATDGRCSTARSPAGGAAWRRVGENSWLTHGEGRHLHSSTARPPVEPRSANPRQRSRTLAPPALARGEREEAKGVLSAKATWDRAPRIRSDPSGVPAEAKLPQLMCYTGHVPVRRSGGFNG